MYRLMPRRLRAGRETNNSGKPLIAWMGKWRQKRKAGRGIWDLAPHKCRPFGSNKLLWKFKKKERERDGQALSSVLQSLGQTWNWELHPSHALRPRSRRGFSEVFPDTSLWQSCGLSRIPTMFPQQSVQLFITLGSGKTVVHPSEIAFILMDYNCFLTCQCLPHSYRSRGGVHGGAAGSSKVGRPSPRNCKDNPLP